MSLSAYILRCNLSFNILKLKSKELRVSNRTDGHTEKWHDGRFSVRPSESSSVVPAAEIFIGQCLDWYQKLRLVGKVPGKI